MKQSNGIWAHITGKCYGDIRELEQTIEYIEENTKFGAKQYMYKIEVLQKEKDDCQSTIKKLLGEIIELKGINEYTSHDYETIITKLKETLVAAQYENAALKSDLKKYIAEHARDRAEKISDKDKAEMNDFIVRNSLIPQGSAQDALAEAQKEIGRLREIMYANHKELKVLHDRGIEVRCEHTSEQIKSGRLPGREAPQLFESIVNPQTAKEGDLTYKDIKDVKSVMAENPHPALDSIFSQIKSIKPKPNPEPIIKPKFRFAEVPKVDNDTWVTNTKIQDEIKNIRDKIKKTKPKKRKKAKKNEA